jgi:hypothetical protein
MTTEKSLHELLTRWNTMPPYRRIGRFDFAIDGVRHQGITDAQALLVFASNDTSQNGADYWITQEVIKKLLGFSYEPRFTTTAEKLREFVGEMVDPEKEKVLCDECHGKGYVECCECGNDVDCEECDGTGKTLQGTTSPEFVKIAGIPVQRSNLAILLPLVTGECQVGVNKSDSIILVSGEGWKILLVRVSLGEEGPEFIP